MFSAIKNFIKSKVSYVTPSLLLCLRICAGLRYWCSHFKHMHTLVRVIYEIRVFTGLFYCDLK